MMEKTRNAYIKELYTLARTIDKLTCGQARIDEFCDEDRIFYLSITPNDGHYKGAVCKFKVFVPIPYPERAPSVICLDTIYHPNIDIDHGEGSVCVNLLDEDWQPGVGLDGCVMALLFLFHNPNTQDAISTVFDGSLMNEQEFSENVKSSLRGEVVEGVKFDRLIDNKGIDETATLLRNNILNKISNTNYILNSENDQLGNESLNRPDNITGFLKKYDAKLPEATPVTDFIIPKYDAKSSEAILTTDLIITKHNAKQPDFFLHMLRRAKFSVNNVYSQIWHKMYSIYQRFFHQQEC